MIYWRVHVGLVYIFVFESTIKVFANVNVLFCEDQHIFAHKDVTKLEDGKYFEEMDEFQTYVYVLPNI